MFNPEIFIPQHLKNVLNTYLLFGLLMTEPEERIDSQ